MVWQPYLSILISIGGITEQRRLHLNRFAPVITGLYMAEAAAPSSRWGMTFAALQRWVCLEGSSRSNNMAVACVCVSVKLPVRVCVCVCWRQFVLEQHHLMSHLNWSHWSLGGWVKQLRTLFYRRVNKRVAIYCQFMPWQVVMEAVRSRLARAAAAAAEGRLGDADHGTAGTGARRVSWHPPAFWSRPHDWL